MTFYCDIQFYRAGLRMPLNPRAALKATWTLQESGGTGQIDVDTGHRYDDLGFVPIIGDVVEIWAVGTGETVPRVRGKVTIPSRTMETTEHRTITAWGRSQDMNNVLLDAVKVQFEGADAAVFAGWLASNYAVRRGLVQGVDYVTDIQPTGVILTELSCADTLASEAMQSIVDNSPGNVVWGWDIDPATGLDRFYMRPRVETLGNQFFIGANVKSIDAPSESTALKNAVKIIGGTARYPNLLTNSSFEAPGAPNGGSGNLLYDGGFEQGDSDTHGWNYSSGGTAGRNHANASSGGQHSASAHSGEWYATINTGGSITQDVRITPGLLLYFTLYIARERGDHIVQGSATLTGLDANGNAVAGESYTLALRPPSTIWTGGSAGTVDPTTALQIAAMFAVSVKCQVTIACSDGPHNEGLLVDDVVLCGADSVSQLGWETKYPNHPSVPGVARFNYIDWANPLAAWEGAYGMRVSARGSAGNVPLIQPVDGATPNGQYNFKPVAQQSVIVGYRVKIDPSAPGNSGVTSGIARVVYKEWGKNNAVNQEQTSDWTIPADNQWRFIWCDPAFIKDSSSPYSFPNGGIQPGITLSPQTCITCHGDVSSASMLIGFASTATFDIDGAVVRDIASGEGTDTASYGSIYADTNYLRGEKFERYVRVDDPALVGLITDPDVLASIATYGLQEGKISNDSIVDWDLTGQSYAAAYFSKWAVPIARPKVSIADETAQTPSPGSGLQVRVIGTALPTPDCFISRATYTWAKQTLAIDLELTNERPSIAKMLLAAASSAGGGGASSSLGALLGQRSGSGQAGGTTAGAGITVYDAGATAANLAGGVTAADIVVGATSLEMSWGTVTNPSGDLVSAVWLPTTAAVGTAGISSPDGTTITINAQGVLSANVPLGNDTPAAETVAATGSAGVSALAAREDHVHAMPGAFGASGISHAAGFVPDPGATAGTTRYLREDGSFAVPPTSTGAQGNPGVAATVTVGTTTTGAAGSSASVTNSGTSSAAVLNFTIPAPVNGTNGASGVSPTISSITASALSAGSNPTASVTAGSNNSYSIALGIPAGAAGSSASVTATAPIVITNGVVSISAATESAAGSMSAADKIKLDGLPSSVFTPASPTAPTGLYIAQNTATSPNQIVGSVYNSAAPAASGGWLCFIEKSVNAGSSWSALGYFPGGAFTDSLASGTARYRATIYGQAGTNTAAITTMYAAGGGSSVSDFTFVQPPYRVFEINGLTATGADTGVYVTLPGDFAGRVLKRVTVGATTPGTTASSLKLELSTAVGAFTVAQTSDIFSLAASTVQGAAVTTFTSNLSGSAGNIVRVNVVTLGTGAAGLYILAEWF